MKEFEQLEDKLNIDGIPEKEKKEKKEVKSSDDHNSDIKSDYEKIREDIMNDLDASSEILDKLKEDILDSDGEDKFLARKAEVFSNLLKTAIDLRKELMTLHASKKTLLEEEKQKGNEKSKGLTSSAVKELLSQTKKNEFF